MFIGFWDVNERNILVEVFETNCEEEITKLFREINSSEPVRFVDLPQQSVIEEDKEDRVRETLEKTVSLLRDKYPDMFKASSRCRPPHVNLDVLRDDLFQSEVMNRHGELEPSTLLKMVEQVNESIKDSLHKKMRNETKSTILSAWEKAKNHNFFLGMDKNWMDLLP